jgi:hypothetical protein
MLVGSAEPDPAKLVASIRATSSAGATIEQMRRGLRGEHTSYKFPLTKSGNVDITVRSANKHLPIPGAS